MRVSVAFHAVTVLVPCGDGSCTVGELIDKAIVRYKKCINKPSDHEIKVKNLRMANGSGYIYNDDTVADVLDDRELVIADFEDPMNMETSSITSFDSTHNFGGPGNAIPPGATPSLTSVDNEEQTPVLDRPMSLWDEAQITDTRRRRWSGSNLTATDSEARESPGSERIPPSLRAIPSGYRGPLDLDHPASYSRTAHPMSPHDTSKRKGGYPYLRGSRRPDISTFSSRSQYTRSILERGESPPDPQVPPSLWRSFGRVPMRYGGRMYRPRSHDFLDDPLERAFFPEDPEMDQYSDHPESFLSQPLLYSAGHFDSARHQGPSGYSLSQPTGSGRHVSFKDKPSQLGPRDRNERPSSLGSGGGNNGMRTLREEPGELRSSDDDMEQRPVADTRAESDSTVSDRDYDPFNRESRKSIRDGPVLEQWENALETRGIPLDDGDSEPTLNGDEMEFDFPIDTGLVSDDQYHHQQQQEEQHHQYHRHHHQQEQQEEQHHHRRHQEEEEEEEDLSGPTLALPVTNGTTHYGLGESGEEEVEVSASSDEGTEELSNIRIIELHKGAQPLGVSIRKAVSADGRDAGIYIASMEPCAFAADSNNLEVNDRILACNGSDFTKMSNDKAVCLFHEMEEERLLRIAISRTVNPTRERCEEELTGEGERGAEGTITSGSSSCVLPTAASNTFTNTRQLGRLYSIDLMKGAKGLGFALTSRDVAANDGERLIYVKSITPGGTAFEDGRLKIGDRLLKVNDEDISGYTRQEVGELLRNTQGKVTLLVSRQEQGGNEDEEEVENSLDSPVAIGKTVITLNIAMDDSGPAGLGITVHGRVNTANPALSHVSGDAGIYIKSIVPGGAAALDKRLLVNDQLLSVNSQSLVGKANDDALQALKEALAKNTANILLVIARKSSTSKSSLKRTDSQCTNDDEESHPTREVGIDVGPSSQSTASFAPSQESFGSSTTPSAIRRDMKLSQDSLRSDQELHLSDPLSDPQRHPVAEGPRRGEIPAVRSGLGQKYSIPEGVAYGTHLHMSGSASSSSLSQGSDRGGKSVSSIDHGSPIHGVMSPTQVDASRSRVMSPSAIAIAVPSSPQQSTSRRKASYEVHVGHAHSPSPPTIPPPPTKYSRRGPPTPLLSPPMTDSAHQSHVLPLDIVPLSHQGEEDSYQSATIPRMNRPSKTKAVTESSVRVDGTTLATAQCELEALEVCSDSEAPNAFQRDGPGRISIKKGKGAPKSLPNVEVQNAEPRMEDDASSMADSELSHDDLLTQDTGIDMNFHSDSPFFPISPPNYSKDDPTGLISSRSQEGRGSLQRAVDRSSFSELTSDVCPMGQDKDLQVSDLTCGAVPLAALDDRKKKDKKKKTIKGFFKKKKDARLRSVDDEKVATGQLSLSQHTGNIQLRQKSGAKALAHQRFSLSVLDTYDDPVAANV